MEFVKPSGRPKTWNVLLYGQGGTGKSVAAASAPGPLLYLNAEGEEALYYARERYGDDKFCEVPFENNITLDLFYLEAKSGKYTTVVVDTIGAVHKKLLANYGGARPTLQQYGDVNLKIERFLTSLRDLPAHNVWLAHEQLDDSEEETVRRPLTGGKKLPEEVIGLAGIVGYTAVLAATEDTPIRYVAQLVPGKGRRCKDRSNRLAGESGFRDMDLAEWFKTASATATNQKPKEAVAI